MYIDIHKHGIESNKEVLVLRNLFPDQLKELDPKGYYSIGLHPWFVNPENLSDQIVKIKDFSGNSEVLAIGEIGLDKKVDVPYRLQMEAFEMQLEIASLAKKPVVIHCVKAYDDIVSFRKKCDLSIPWIIHWFNSSLQTANQLLSLNCYLSYGCMLFKEGSKALKGFSKIPLESIFLETDDTEYSIFQVYKKASDIRNIDTVDLKYQMNTNFKNCFDIKL